jgi:hypothetical protein
MSFTLHSSFSRTVFYVKDGFIYIAQQNSAVLYIEVLTKITVVPLLYLKSDGLVQLAGIVIGLLVIFPSFGILPAVPVTHMSTR